jgi:hypothetical protein
VGEHNDFILGKYLKMGKDELKKLREEGAI